MEKNMEPYTTLFGDVRQKFLTEVVHYHGYQYHLKERSKVGGIQRYVILPPSDGRIQDQFTKISCIFHY